MPTNQPPEDMTSYGKSPTYGAYTSDYVPDYPQIIKFKDSIELRKKYTRDFLQTFCEITFEQQIEVATAGGVKMQEVGRDMAAPSPQHTGRYMLDINAPRKFQAGTAVTEDAWMHGMSETKLRQQTMAPLIADQEWCEQFIIGTALTPAGWYNADLTPPAVGANVFTSSHSHYVTYASAGVPLPEMSSFCKWHITHHGYNPNSVVALMHSASGVLFEQTYGLMDADAYASLPMIQNLISYGFQPGTPLSGVPTLFTDWIPVGYALYIALGEEKPMVWKPENRPESIDLLMYQDVPIPNSQYHWWGTATRYGAPTIQAPGAGVAVQFNADENTDAYATPDNVLDIAM